MSTPKLTGALPHALSLPQRLATAIHHEIVRACTPGDRLPAMRELAKRYVVSINTVGAALDLLAADGTVEKRHGSGVYVSEQAPRRIGILSELDLMNPAIGPYFRGVAGHAKRLLEARGYESRLYVGNQRPALVESDTVTCPQFWDDLHAGHLHGAVLIDVPSTDAWAGRVLRAPVPLVGHHSGYTVEPDFRGIIRSAVAQLCAQGCRRLGLIAWADPAPFVEAVAALGLETHDSWIVRDAHPGVAGAGWEGFRDIWSSTATHPDGLLILDDVLFTDAQFAMLQLRLRVPDDLRVVVQCTAGSPPRTSLPVHLLSVDPAEAAERLVDMLEARLAGQDPPPTVHHLAFRDEQAPQYAELPATSAPA